ncbi:hypothetical protein NDU88_004468 [Pleurodeles waltl]|uniref:Uncharacterized protein n=1 Tax=Pleurodeles waltl TaxID=8319 RepID=A0AAV7L1I5_PLEWA|nr:hypothetical protein NDU88_004468 [Pleurodeles waltl]
MDKFAKSITPDDDHSKPLGNGTAHAGDSQPGAAIEITAMLQAIHDSRAATETKIEEVEMDMPLFRQDLRTTIDGVKEAEDHISTFEDTIQQVV